MLNDKILKKIDSTGLILQTRYMALFTKQNKWNESEISQPKLG